MRFSLHLTQLSISKREIVGQQKKRIAESRLILSMLCQKFDRVHYHFFMDNTKSVDSGPPACCLHTISDLDLTSSAILFVS